MYVIYEEAFVPKAPVKILKENKIGDDMHKAIFKCVLQEAGVVNQNKRRYSDDTIAEIVRQLAPKAKNRALLGEVDHPDTGSRDEQIIMRRAATVKLKDAGILIRDIKKEGKYVYGECETLGNRHGQDIFAMIKENVQIGFSLRALGSMQTGKDGIIDVIKPIKAITYDVVANPSHSNALIMNFLTEGVSTLDITEEGIITESGEILTEAQLDDYFGETVGKVKICNENSCVLLDRSEINSYIMENIDLKNFRKAKLFI